MHQTFMYYFHPFEYKKCIKSEILPIFLHFATVSPSFRFADKSFTVRSESNRNHRTSKLCLEGNNIRAIRVIRVQKKKHVSGEREHKYNELTE